MDGVLRSGDNILPGCEDFLKFIQNEGFRSCIISNTTRYTGKSIRDFFSRKNVNIDKISIITALDATVNYVGKHFSSTTAYCMPEAIPAFGSLHREDAKESVVIGDMGNLWTFDIMNDIFRKVNDGATLIAMQKNKFWKQPDGNLALDAGAFVSAIEYATGKDAILLGKPDPLFFKSALEMCKGDENHFFMLGDDLYSDVKASEDIGATGILTLTGKTTKKQLKGFGYSPHHVVNNLKEVIGIIG